MAFIRKFSGEPCSLSLPILLASVSCRPSLLANEDWLILTAGIVYSVIAPLILVFCAISFVLILFAFQYNLLYVLRPDDDYGGALYPTALNQLFTGVYVLSFSCTGLFLLVRNDGGKFTCVGQAVIAASATGLTLAYQVMLNQAYAPLLRHLPLVSSASCHEGSSGQSMQQSEEYDTFTFDQEDEKRTISDERLFKHA